MYQCSTRGSKHYSTATAKVLKILYLGKQSHWISCVDERLHGSLSFRSTRPKVLLRIAGTLFSHAIQQCTERKLDKEVMNNGFSYFLGPLLNWTLIGVVKVLLTEIEQRLCVYPMGMSAQASPTLPL